MTRMGATVRWLAWMFVGLAAMLSSTVWLATAAPRIELLIDLPPGDVAGGLAVGPDGLLYVSVSDGGRTGTVLVLSPSGRIEDRMSIAAGSSGEVSLRGLAVDRLGTVYVADAANFRENRGRIVRINSRGRQSIFASRLSAPSGIAVDEEGIVYVTDGLNGAVRWIGPDGASASFVEDDQLLPHGRSDVGASSLVLAPDESVLYIGHEGDGRIFRLPIRSDGSAGRLRVFSDQLMPREGSGSGLDGVAGLALDHDGNLLAAARHTDRLHLIDPDGSLMARISVRDRDAQRSLTALVASDQTVYVAGVGADDGLSRIYHFSLGDLED